MRATKPYVRPHCQHLLQPAASGTHHVELSVWYFRLHHATEDCATWQNCSCGITIEYGSVARIAHNGSITSGRKFKMPFKRCEALLWLRSQSSTDVLQKQAVLPQDMTIAAVPALVSRLFCTSTPTLCPLHRPADRCVGTSQLLCIGGDSPGGPPVIK